MAFRDRFYTRATARALMSWRLLLVPVVAVATWWLGLWLPAAVVVGIAAYGLSVVVAMPRGTRGPSIDPFTLSEPWRRYMQGSVRADRRLHQTVAGTRAGPLRDRLEGIAARIDHGLLEAWEVAKRGDEIDDAIRRLDPTLLRSRLDTFRTQAASDPTPQLDTAIASLERQLETAERLRALSEQTADRLRLTQTRFEELVVRAEEVSIGVSDTDTYASDVDDLVDELEGLRLAVEETRES